jgi:type II secretory pathway pseudopilin PulG
VATVLLLASLAVAIAIFASVLKLIAVQRQSVASQTRQVQADWLAESAIERAAARLAADSGYHGETWNLSPQEISSRDGAAILIRVDEVPGKPDRRAVHVQADYPDDPYQRARQVRDVIVPLKGPKP